MYHIREKSSIHCRFKPTKRRGFMALDWRHLHRKGDNKTTTTDPPPPPHTHTFYHPCYVPSVHLCVCVCVCVCVCLLSVCLSVCVCVISEGRLRIHVDDHAERGLLCTLVSETPRYRTDSYHHHHHRCYRHLSPTTSITCRSEHSPPPMMIGGMRQMRRGRTSLNVFRALKLVMLKT